MKKLFEMYDKNPVYPVGQVNGRIGIGLDPLFSESDSESDGEKNTTAYEQEYVRQEMKKYAGIKPKNTTDYESSVGGFSEVEDAGVPGHAFGYLEVFKQYNFDSYSKKDLPIDSFREKILRLVDVNNVVVIQGPTGCGKTTQVPQYILDYCRENNEMCNIVVTQPRKIATINVARRVCAERGWTIGTVCGYQVGLEKQISPNMLLTYVTTGVLLQKIIMAKNLHMYSHIIIDEVHERNQELDFMLLIVRKFLFTNSPNTKVILMSATIEANEFAHYFRTQSPMQDFLAPIILVDKQSSYRKQIIYCDQLNVAQVPHFEIDKPEIFENVWLMFLFLVKAIDKIDNYEDGTSTKRIGSVLVFLPGILEIEEANKRLLADNERKETDIKWEIIPLHSSLPNDEQAKVFKPHKEGYRKVILSTNIAESSITVPDMDFVIDFCLTKVVQYDTSTNYSTLKLEWASHVNCDQRAGRVGRVSNGRVYRLVSRNFYEKTMPRDSVPEILRAPLDRVVLQAKMLNMAETPKQILALALNPPNLSNIESTVWHLKEIGGLLMTCRGIYAPSDGDLTFLGTVMASLPVDVSLSKLIVLGHMFNCVDDAVIIAAGCTIQNIFSIPFQQKFSAYQKMLVWADGSCSDLIAYLNLYHVWQSNKRDKSFENHQAELRWCQRSFVSCKGLNEWELLVKELRQRLERLKILDPQFVSRTVLSSYEKSTVLKIITSGAFYPNYFIRAPRDGKYDEREAVRVVGGRDPHRTVYFTGMDSSQPGPLYVRAIKKLMEEGGVNTDNVMVGFDGSCKIYVEFKTLHEPVSVHMDGHQVITAIPGKIPMQVYEAIRKRQLRMDFRLRLLPNLEAWEWADRYGIVKGAFSPIKPEPTERNCFSQVDFTAIPSLDTEYITIVVTAPVDAGHFWAQNFNDETSHLTTTIYEILNRQVLAPLDKPAGHSNVIKIGQLFAARFAEDGKFYRCRVISYGPDYVQVLFIDYGNIQNMKINDLHHLPQREECFINPLAMECVLRGIRPILHMNPKGVWSDEVNNMFIRKTENIILYGKVYSVVDDVIYLELYRKLPSGRNQQNLQSLNEWLVKEGFAQVTEESYLSKDDHERRMLVQKSDNPDREAARMSMDKITSYSDFKAPEIGRNYTTVELKGPFSPLEMKIYGCLEGGAKKVDIESTSVNTVLLDNDPQDPHSRLLVARHVSRSVDGSRFVLRQTTILPNIPGLPMLLALLFTPCMEPKITADGVRVATILCGLGSNKFTGRPRFPAHDITIDLDTELRVAEIEKINEMRFLMNSYIKSMSNLDRDHPYEGLVSKQNKLKSKLFELIKMPRLSVERTTVKYNNVWGKFDKETIVLRSSIPDDPEDIWPLHSFVKLNNNAEVFNPKLLENLEMLDQIAKSMLPAREITCELCENEMFSMYDVIDHIMTESHKAAQAQYFKKLESGENDEESDDED